MECLLLLKTQQKCILLLDEGFIEVEPEPGFDLQAVTPNEEIISYPELNSLEHNAGQSSDERVEDHKEPTPTQVFQDITQVCGQQWTTAFYEIQ